MAVRMSSVGRVTVSERRSTRSMVAEPRGVPVKLGSRTVAALTGLVVALTLSGCAVNDLLIPNDDSLMRRASLTADDAAANATFAPYEDGDVVAGQDSLDLCYAS